MIHSIAYVGIAQPPFLTVVVLLAFSALPLATIAGAVEGEEPTSLNERQSAPPQSLSQACKWEIKKYCSHRTTDVARCLHTHRGDIVSPVCKNWIAQREACVAAVRDAGCDLNQWKLTQCLSRVHEDALSGSCRHSWFYKSLKLYAFRLRHSNYYDKTPAPTKRSPKDEDDG